MNQSIDLRSKYLSLLHPSLISFWDQLRRTLAILIYPLFKREVENDYRQYFTHEYMLSVHKAYESEVRKLNRALTKVHVENKELRKEIAFFENHTKH